MGKSNATGRKECTVHPVLELETPLGEKMVSYPML
jgi:hypothetical protein